MEGILAGARAEEAKAGGKKTVGPRSVDAPRSWPSPSLVSVAQPTAPWRPSFELVQPDLFSAPAGRPTRGPMPMATAISTTSSRFRGRPNRFYRNDNGTFRDVAADVGLADNQETRVGRVG